MVKLLTRKQVIERELCKTTRIFGEEYDVQIIYTKIENPELDLIGKTVLLNLCLDRTNYLEKYFF